MLTLVSAGPAVNDPETMNPTILDRVRDGHRILIDLVSGLDTTRLRQPSRLPGWSRAHAIAHLAHNAQALARVTRHALQDELADLYPDGDRDSAIERDAALEFAELAKMLDSAQEELEGVWAKLDSADRQRPVRFRDGTIHDLMLCRWRENEIHAVDLALGRTEDSWSPEFCEHALDFLAPRLEGHNVIVVPDDLTRTWAFGDTSQRLVRGPARTVACWLAGREPQQPPTAESELPELGPWP